MIKITESGIGGVSILKHVYKKFPHADFEYTCNFSAKNIFLEKIETIINTSSQHSRFGRIGIVCETALDEKIIDNYIQNRDSNKNIFITKTLPLLKTLIEENWEKKPETKSILRKNLLPLKSNNIDTLILFSPYFDILKKEFQKKMGKNCIIISASEIVAEEITQTLTNEMCNNKKQFFLNTNLYTVEKFKMIAQKFFCEGISTKSIKTLETI